MNYSSEDEFDNYINARLNERRPMIAKKIIRDFQNPFEYYNEDEFRKRYRFTKEVVLSIILPLLSDEIVYCPKGGFVIPILQIYQLLVVLRLYAIYLISGTPVGAGRLLFRTIPPISRFYATGSFQIITDQIKISQLTVSRIVKKVSHTLSTYISKVSKQFGNKEHYRITHFPGVVGIWNNYGTIDELLLGDCVMDVKNI